MKSAIIFFALLLLGIFASSSVFIIPEWEQVILTEFGRPSPPVTQAGIHFKKPFIQTINRIDKRILEWDGRSSEMPTRDKLFVVIDTFARWKISDSQLYFVRLRDERSALSRLDDFLGGETRTAVARHDLIEIIRTSKDRKPGVSGDTGQIIAENIRFDPITVGRPGIEKEIYDAAKGKLAEFGIDLLDIRFKRINYNPSVESRIFDRMVSERQQISERFRSEGAGEAARILGNMEREVNSIKSAAYKKVQAISGDADAKATSIYAAAYNQSPEASEFYAFTKALETYRTSLGGDTTAILSTKSPLLRYLQGESPPHPQPP